MLLADGLGISDHLAASSPLDRRFSRNSWNNRMIDLKTIKSLIKLMMENELSELDVRDKDEQVSLKRGGAGAVSPLVHHSPVLAGQVQASAAPAGKAAPAADEGLKKITSPMVGTFYASSSPEVEPFVKVGSHVGPDTVVCIIEAMKVFNEIKAECAGTIARVVAQNGHAVEFGQPMFLVKPD